MLLNFKEFVTCLSFYISRGLEFKKIVACSVLYFHVTNFQGFLVGMF